MSSIITFSPRRQCVGTHRRCPFCDSMDGFVNISAQQWGVCDRHRVKWYLGANLTDDWLRESRRDWIANAHYLDALERVYPDDEREHA
jgi:hypothetical protein